MCKFIRLDFYSIKFLLFSFRNAKWAQVHNGPIFLTVIYCITYEVA